MRCAVIECSRPVFSVSVAFGFLILGEENGVRVFGLRRLVKGRSGKRVGNSKPLKNGGRGGGLEAVNCNGDLEGKMERHGGVTTAVSQTIWISDGCHSVHMFTAMDIENALKEADGNDCNEKLRGCLVWLFFVFIFTGNRKW
ncbi:uncharacterized protein LOC114398269 isoform X2 [Glycine soja]|uniref:uncharacterized protein LOC114398269 isoform X2 n=1 Tax=Glycine soja TaxID=3848 RepID=UPI0003DED747|nr:uncharacterized protein LOC114398269 isoform X2 [Glycine soja]|eukprot:XP_006603969.1 uncharacterized protein LOC100805053 isoform X2 [Glycine max]